MTLVGLTSWLTLKKQKKLLTLVGLTSWLIVRPPLCECQDKSIPYMVTTTILLQNNGHHRSLLEQEQGILLQCSRGFASITFRLFLTEWQNFTRGAWTSQKWQIDWFPYDRGLGRETRNNISKDDNIVTSIVFFLRKRSKLKLCSTIIVEISPFLWKIKFMSTFKVLTFSAHHTKSKVY